MSAVHESTALYSPSTGVIRASNLGPAYFSPCVSIKVLWSQPIYVSPETHVNTLRGWRHAGSLTDADWLNRGIHDRSDKFHRPAPFDCIGMASEVYPFMHQTLLTDPVGIVDMMFSTVPHWKADRVIMRPKQHLKHYWGMVSREQNAWGHQVLEAVNTFQNLVQLDGYWEIYGFQIA